MFYQWITTSKWVFSILLCFKLEVSAFVCQTCTNVSFFIFYWSRCAIRKRSCHKELFEYAKRTTGGAPSGMTTGRVALGFLNCNVTQEGRGGANFLFPKINTSLLQSSVQKAGGLLEIDTSPVLHYSICMHLLRCAQRWRGGRMYRVAQNYDYDRLWCINLDITKNSTRAFKVMQRTYSTWNKMILQNIDE